MKKFVSYFLQGLLYTVPLVVTAYILFQLFQLTDGLLSSYLNEILPFEIPGLGIIIIIIIITLIGILGKFVITKPFVSFFDGLFNKAPLIKVIYTSVKELLSAFVGKERKFNQPVLVKINENPLLEKLGFITQTDSEFLEIEKTKITVYFPHSYAFSGEHYIVPSSNITRLDKAPADVMKFIVSGGVTKI